jgi:predicted tellurium resistance membrane protein TerC
MIEAEILGSLLLLIVLEIVLGIDNLVFIAILADRLPACRWRWSREWRCSERSAG